MIKIRYLLTILLAVSPAVAQYYPLPYPSRPRPQQPESHAPIAVGGFYDLGIQTQNDSQAPHSTLTAAIGVYVEWTPRRLQPGLDLRFTATDGMAHGVLVGPRVATTLIIFHPYAEALFGPNQIDSSSSTQQRSGVTSEFVLGVEGDLSPHIRWRILEFTQGTFTGLPGSSPRTISTGFVLHL